MIWAVGFFTIVTVLFAFGWIRAAANVRHAEDNWNVVFCGAGTVVFGIIDFILTLVWLAVT